LLQRPQFAASYKNVAVLTHRPPHHSSPTPQFEGGVLPVVGGFPVIFGHEGESNINERSSNSTMTERRMTACVNSSRPRLRVMTLQQRSASV